MMKLKTTKKEVIIKETFKNCIKEMMLARDKL